MTIHHTCSDNQLTELLVLGDRQAFHEIYLRYWKKLYQFAEKKIPKEAAEEIVQDVFVNTWQRHTEPIINLNYYLFSATKYGILNYFKKQLTESEYVKHQKHLRITVENTTDYDLMLQELQTAIQEALLQLPEKTQQVFRLSRFDFLPHKEIATQLNISEKSIEYHITQAIKTLREYLKKNF